MSWASKRRRSGFDAVLLIAAALGAACGEGREVSMGVLAVAAPSKPDGGSPGGACGHGPCSDHEGSKVFLEPSAADASAAAFDEGVERAPGTDPSAEPRVLYPSHESMVPVNLSRLRFAWAPGTSSLFALDFSGPRTTVRIVSRETSWSPTEEEWEWIAESNRGQPVDLVVKALDPAAPGDVWRSAPIALYFSERPLEGAIYYWSTGSQGLMRAALDTANPVRVFSDPRGAEAGTCTGCHTISRDGTRLAAGYDKNQLAEISLLDGTTLVPKESFGVPSEPAPAPDAGPMPMPDPPEMMPKPPKPPPAVWSTFSPDGRRLLVAGGGKLRLIDADTGAPVGGADGVVPLPDGVDATHPDWSPLGDRVAVTLGERGGDKQTENGSIALLSYADETFGTPETVVPANGDKDNNVFPSFSPDGRFVAYVNVNGGSQEAPSASLRLLDLESGTVHELTRLNQRVGAEDGLIDLGNTMPTWAPSTTAGLYWLSFSSLRAYSDQRPADLKLDQLWLAAIDPTKEDPGFAALWAPFQSIAHGNHRAIWTPEREDAFCGCVELCADGRDNDCDGVADETDCVGSCLEREICANEVDDDCDCVVDDCSSETCDDGVDNDGDGKSDKMDPACK
jgi:hypothetical protein